MKNHYSVPSNPHLSLRPTGSDDEGEGGEARDRSWPTQYQKDAARNKSRAQHFQGSVGNIIVRENRRRCACYHRDTQECGDLAQAHFR